MIRVSSQERDKVKMWPMYEAIGKKRAVGLPGYHALTGCDINGKTKGVGKTSSSKTFMNAPSHIIEGLTELGIGNEPKGILGWHRVLLYFVIQQARKC